MEAREGVRDDSVGRVVADVDGADLGLYTSVGRVRGAIDKGGLEQNERIRQNLVTYAAAVFGHRQSADGHSIKHIIPIDTSLRRHCITPISVVSATCKRIISCTRIVRTCAMIVTRRRTRRAGVARAANACEHAQPPRTPTNTKVSSSLLLTFKHAFSRPEDYYSFRFANLRHFSGHCLREVPLLECNLCIHDTAGSCSDLYVVAEHDELRVENRSARCCCACNSCPLSCSLAYLDVEHRALSYTTDVDTRSILPVAVETRLWPVWLFVHGDSLRRG